MDLKMIEWKTGDCPWQGEFRGFELGSGVSVIFNCMSESGLGPRLHKHPYSETFIVRRGSVEFTDGQRTLVAHAGQIVVVGPHVPHAFVGVGALPIEMFDIHDSPRFVTEWL